MSCKGSWMAGFRLAVRLPKPKPAGARAMRDGAFSSVREVPGFLPNENSSVLLSCLIGRVWPDGRRHIKVLFD